MFDKLKELNKLRKLKNEAESEVFEAEKEGARVVVNGGLVVQKVVLGPEMNAEKQGVVLRDCLNDALKKAQMSMAKKFSGMMQ